MEVIEQTTESGAGTKNASVDSLAARMKYARDVAAVTMPTWQAPACAKTKSVINITDSINNALSKATDFLTIAVQNGKGETLARATPLLYFSGILISNFQPTQTELDETLSNLDMMFGNIENDIIGLVKRVKKLSTGFKAYKKSVLHEFHKTAYKALIDFEYGNRDGQEASLQSGRTQFEKHPLLNSDEGAWLDLVNYEREVITLELNEGTGILAQKLSFTTASTLVNSLTAEIHEAVKNATSAVNEIEVKADETKQWKQSAVGLVQQLRDIRRQFNFGEANCAGEFVNVLSELQWKLNVVTGLRMDALNNVCVWILKGIECIRRKSAGWAPERQITTSRPVLKYISTTPPGRIYKFFPCLPSKAGTDPDYVSLFEDMGTSIGESFHLELLITSATRDLLLEEKPQEQETVALGSSLKSIPQSVTQEESQSILAGSIQSDKESEISEDGYRSQFQDMNKGIATAASNYAPDEESTEYSIDETGKAITVTAAAAGQWKGGLEPVPVLVQMLTDAQEFGAVSTGQHPNPEFIPPMNRAGHFQSDSSSLRNDANTPQEDSYFWARHLASNVPKK